MGINRMDHFISIGRYKNIIDSKGFNSPVFETLAKTRSFEKEDTEANVGAIWPHLAKLLICIDFELFLI